jgi:hypothetical protein
MPTLAVRNVGVGTDDFVQKSVLMGGFEGDLRVFRAFFDAN